MESGGWGLSIPMIISIVHAHATPARLYLVFPVGWPIKWQQVLSDVTSNLLTTPGNLRSICFNPGNQPIPHIETTYLPTYSWRYILMY